MKERLQRRLTRALAVVAVAVSALFGVFAVGLGFSIEPYVFEGMLDEEATRQRQHQAQHGQWPEPHNPWVVLHRNAAALPAELATLAQQPSPQQSPQPIHRGVVGAVGRFHRVLALGEAGGPPWLSVEVSRTYALRPMRQLVLGWVLAWAAAMLALLLTAGWWLSRHMTAPLQRLAARIADAAPEQLPPSLTDGLRDDEVGAVARRFDTLLARTRQFIAREQAFTRDVSHELRTPLAVLRMAIERLRADTATAPALHRQLMPMAEAVELMAQTVDALLMLAREQAVAPGVPTAPTAPVVSAAPLRLVEQWVLAHAGWLDDRRVTLDITLLRDDSLRLPEPVLRVVLATLLANALAHGAPGGTVHIGFSKRRLCIRNASADLPAGFGGAYIKGDASSGSGLGLDLARRLLERHGATLQVTHADGHTCACVGESGLVQGRP